MKISSILKRTAAATILLVFACSSVASGLDPEQKRVMQSGSEYFNVEESPRCELGTPSGSSGTVKNLYMLGDSITNGANQKYRTVLTAKGITPFINAVGGRAWIYSGSGAAGAFTPEAGGAQKGNAAVEADGTQIAASDGIVIALGSNGGLAANPIPEMIAAIRAKNPTAPIWWVNAVASDTKTVPSVTVYGEFNTTLQSLSSSLGFSIIDWHGAVIPGGNPADVPTSTVVDPNNYLSGDGLHPTSAGQDALVALVAGSLSAGTPANPSTGTCGCSVTNPGANPGTPQENYQNAWNFFVTVKGLSKEAAAGIMGNLEVESGINPQNTQNDAKDASGNPVPDGPEIPFELIKDKFGYGIAQWTSIGRQQGLINFAAKPPPRSTGDLGLQLDFLWEELTVSYTGVIALLQEPGVTLEAASDEVLLHFETPLAVLPPPKGTAASKQAAIDKRRANAAAIFNTYSGLPAGSFNGSSCTGTGAVIDTEDPDTADIPCAAGTTDSGETDAYNSGVTFRIRICNAGGVTVNSQLSGSVKKLLDDAATAGIPITGGGFRTLAGQVLIYNQWCDVAGVSPTPPPYPKATLNDYVKCPGGAPPGYSNHEMGFAIDFNCDGVLLPRSYADASSNECFNWLVANGGKYSLFEYGRGTKRDTPAYEGWHWSADGS